jgi:predicted transcriptional regulator
VASVLGPLGAAIMRVLWSGGDTTLRSIVEQLAAHGRAPAYTTITTILGRLRERGLVERSARGSEAVYRAAVSEADLIEASSGRAVDELLERYGAIAMRHFAERLADVDAELRTQLLALAEQHSNRPGSGRA